MATQAMFRIWRGDPAAGKFQDFTTVIDEGMVVLDAVHRIQAQQAPDLAMTLAGLPLEFDGRRPPYRHSAPRLGQHNDLLSAQDTPRKAAS